MQFFARNGRVINIDENDRLGRGLEGAVYPASSWSAAKILRPETLQKHGGFHEQKIVALAELGRHARTEPLQRIIWPLHPLYTKQGDFAGFEMVRISDAITLLDAASDEDWPFCERQDAAWQLARIYRDAHAVGILVGDGKLENALYKESTRHVCIVDSNSLHLPAFPGTAITIDYVRPEEARRAEAQKTSKDEPARYRVSRAADNHALAVQLFQLLLLNVHPFSAGDSIEECVKHGYCAFPYEEHGNRKRVRSGPYLRQWRRLPRHLQAMFSAAFHRDRAPEPAEWEIALSSGIRKRKAS